MGAIGAANPSAPPVPNRANSRVALPATRIVWAHAPRCRIVADADRDFAATRQIQHVELPGEEHESFFDRGVCKPKMIGIHARRFRLDPIDHRRMREPRIVVVAIMGMNALMESVRQGRRA